MSLRDYYRCKQCDSKIAYDPDRQEEDWEPFLLCRMCADALARKVEELERGLETRRAAYDRQCDVQSKMMLDSLTLQKENREQAATIERLRGALIRAERKLMAYVGVCKGDKELTNTVLPMCDAALNPPESEAK